MKKYLIAIFFLVGCIATTAQNGLPRIAVLTKISEPKYLEQYGDSILSIQRELADSIARMLNRYLHVFEFRSNMASPDTIVFMIARARGELSVPIFFNVNLLVKIFGSNVAEGERRIVAEHPWVFAPLGNYDDVIGASAKFFIVKALERIRQLITADQFDTFVSKILSNRLITEKKEMVENSFPNPVWKLPFTFGDLLIGENSRFVVVQTHETDIVRKFCAKVISRWSASKRVIIEGIHPIANDPYDDPTSTMLSSFKTFDGFRIISISGYSGVAIVSPIDSGIR